MKYHRKVIRITADDSPNVKLAVMQKERGLEVTGDMIVPGVISYEERNKRLKLWDQVRITIGLNAQFYVGAELLLYPPAWIDNSNSLSSFRKTTTNYGPKQWMGIDPAEGGDKSAWAIIDEWGLTKLLSRKTPRTTDVVDITQSLIREHAIPQENICMDRGGGGKQHADRLRQLGIEIRTVGFGESVTPELRRMRVAKPYPDRVDAVEERYVYFNRRSQLYGEFSIMLDPSENGAALGLAQYEGFAIPTGGIYDELRKQMAPIPKTWDRTGEGRLKILPKNNAEDPNDDRTLVSIIGHSPDELDALVLACHARLHKARRVTLGAWS